MGQGDRSRLPNMVYDVCRGGDRYDKLLVRSSSPVESRQRDGSRSLKKSFKCVMLSVSEASSNHINANYTFLLIRSFVAFGSSG